MTDWAHLMPAGLYDFIPLEGMSASDGLTRIFSRKFSTPSAKFVLNSTKSMLYCPVIWCCLFMRARMCSSFCSSPVPASAFTCRRRPSTRPYSSNLRTDTHAHLWQPVIVQGQLSTTGAVTEYTDTGYRILADEVVDFSFDELDIRLSAIEGTAN